MPDLKVLDRGLTLSRIYFAGGKFPTAWDRFRYYGPTGSRFDHQLEPARLQGRGILYAATNAATTFAEVFQETRTIHLRRHAPWLAIFRLRRVLTLLDLTTAWITRVGGSMAIHAAPRFRTRPWSRLFYESYPKIDGLYYYSSMNSNDPMVALYERAKTALPKTPDLNRALGDPHLAPYLADVAKTFGCIVWPPLTA